MQSQRKTVLVVEDEPDLCELMRDVLESSGYMVTTAENGRAGLATIAQQIPNVILLDMRMPVMNGWEFAREFRDRHNHLAPLVVVTAAADAQSRAEEIGAEDWVGKPFDLQDLLAVVDRHVAAPRKLS